MNQPPKRPQRPSTPRAGIDRHTTPRSAEVERALALRDVMDHAVKVQREITAPKRLKDSRAKAIFAFVVCVPLLGLSVYSFVARPAFIWGGGVPAVSGERQSAQTRVGLVFLAQRVEGFREHNGHYPASLAAINEAVDGVEYRLLSDSLFELRTVVGQEAIVFRSDSTARAFLGNSLAVIQRREP